MAFFSCQPPIDLTTIRVNWSQRPNPWLFAVYEGRMLPGYTGIIISHYKDPYFATSIMGFLGFVCCSCELSFCFYLFPAVDFFAGPVDSSRVACLSCCSATLE